MWQVILLFLSFFTITLHATPYSVKKIELSGYTFPESHLQTFYYLTMNDEGLVCSSATNFSGREYKVFLSDKAIDECDYRSEVLLNNRGWSIYKTDCQTILRSPEGEKIPLPEGEVLALNDRNQVMIRDWKRGYYLWEDGHTNLTVFEEMRQDLENQGYCVDCLRLYVLNNCGTIAGYVQIVNSQKVLPFYWDGKAHIIDCPLTLSPHISTIAINNKDEIIFTNTANSFLWRKEGVSVVIPNFYAISINDSSQILGELTKGRYFVPALWEGGSITTLAKLLDFRKRPGKYLEPYTYDFTNPSALRDPVKINNRGEIVLLGRIGYQWFPCILSPTPQEQHPQEAKHQ